MCQDWQKSHSLSYVSPQKYAWVPCSGIALQWDQSVPVISTNYSGSKLAPVKLSSWHRHIVKGWIRPHVLLSFSQLRKAQSGISFLRAWREKGKLTKLLWKRAEASGLFGNVSESSCVHFYAWHYFSYWIQLFSIFYFVFHSTVASLEFGSEQLCFGLVLDRFW